MRVCFFCSKPGHVKADCYLYKRQQQKSANTEEGRSSASAKIGIQSGHVTFNAREEAVRTGRWYIDSDATSHMTNESNFFSVIRDTTTTVFLADGSAVKTAGTGEGHLACEVSDNRVQAIELTDVLYVPQLDGGLISVPRITEKGYRVIFERNLYIIYHGQRVVARAIQEGNLYRLKTVEASTRTVNTEKCIHHWHRRLGHRDLYAIKKLISEDLAIGIKITTCSDNTVCEHCIKGKLTQTKFLKSKNREKEPMKLIHSDLCGPMQTATPSGNRYFLTLIDDCSRFTVVRLLKTKDEVLRIIKEYIGAMTVRFGKKPIALQIMAKNMFQLNCQISYGRKG